MMKSNGKLLDLLAQNRQNPLADQLLREVSAVSEMEATGPIALCEVKDIYRFRARRNTNMGSPIQGFPNLLVGLDAFSADTVVIYSVHSEAGPYKIFADEAQTEIAGILKFPAASAENSLPVLAELQAA